MPVRSSSFNDVVSNAFNFSSFVSGSVDMRTLSYNAEITLGRLLGNALGGPNFELKLGFSFNAGSSPFGAGWRLMLSNFSNGRLNLSSGESYIVTDRNTPNWVLQYNPKRNLRVFFTEDDNNTVIKYANGLTEILDDQNKLIEIRNKNGRKVKLHWQRSVNGPYPRHITDEYNNEIILEATSQGFKCTYQNKKSNEKHVVNLAITKNRLISASLPNNSDKVYKFVYNDQHLRDTGTILINSVKRPTGVIETMNYNNHLEMPNNSPVTSILALSSRRIGSYKQHEALEDVTEEIYAIEGGQNNYLGANSGKSYEANHDTLFSCGNDYRYKTSRTISVSSFDDNGHISKKTHKLVREYNKFHLMEKETQYITRKKIDSKPVQIVCKQLTYYADLKKTIEEQPGNYNLVNKTVSTYFDPDETNTSSTYTIHEEYDDYGNLLSKQNGDNGIKTVYIYYPAEGCDEQGFSCPPDPDNFIRSLKSRTVIPSCTDNNERPQTLEYSKYALMDCVDKTDGQFLVCCEERNPAGLKTTFDYEDSQDSFFYGHIKSSQETYTPDLTDNQAYTTTKNFNVTLNQEDNTLTEETVTIGAAASGHDQPQKTASIVRSLFHGREVQVTDENGVKTEIVYDDVNFDIKQIITAKGSPTEASVSYEYNIQENNNFVTVTNVNGAVSRFVYDNGGRHIETHIQTQALTEGQDPEFKKIGEVRYDCLGRVQSKTICDYIDENNRLIKSLNRYTYSVWGQSKSIIDVDSAIHLSYHNLAKRSHQSGIKGYSTSEKLMNEFGQHVATNNYDAKGTLHSSEKITYDGLDRHLSHTDMSGLVSRFTYDNFSRLKTTKIGDEYVLTHEYCSYRPENHVAGLKLGDIEVGSQTFDGLGRVITKSVGEQVTTSSYNDHFGHPDTVVMPNGATNKYTYDPTLRRVTKIETDVGEINKEFCALSGLPKTYKLGDVENTYEYDARHFSGDASVSLSGDKKTSSVKRSVNGKLLAEEDFNGGTANYTYYEDSGRLKTITQQDGSTVNATYDDIGRIHTVTHTAKNAQQVMTTTEYDDFHREIKRTITQGDGNTVENTIILEVTYEAKTGYLQSRKRTLNDQVVLAESFAYDAYNRLKTVTYDTDTMAPADEYGNRIAREEYEYSTDGSGLLKTITRTFASSGDDSQDSDSNVTTYTYDPKNYGRLVKLENTHTSYPKTLTIAYANDKSGNVHTVTDDVGNVETYDYDRINRLIKLSYSSGKDSQLIEFGYDANGKLVKIAQNGQERKIWRRGTTRLNESTQDEVTSYTHLGNREIAAQKGDKTVQHLNDTTGSIVAENTSEGLDHYIYTPYGYPTRLDKDGTPQKGPLNTDIGVSGQQLLNSPKASDQGKYLLGDGYRVYDSRFGTFLAPDGASPFGGGGNNPYAYGNYNPINYYDPSGHAAQKVKDGIEIGIGILSALALLFSGGSALSIVLGITATLAGIGAPIIDLATHGSHSRTAVIAERVLQGVSIASASAEGIIAIAKVTSVAEHAGFGAVEEMETVGSTTAARAVSGQLSDAEFARQARWIAARTSVLQAEENAENTVSTRAQIQELHEQLMRSAQRSEQAEIDELSARQTANRYQVRSENQTETNANTLARDTPKINKQQLAHAIFTLAVDLTQLGYDEWKLSQGVPPATQNSRRSKSMSKVLQVPPPIQVNKPDHVLTPHDIRKI